MIISLIRSFIIYLLVIFVIRLMGKRQLAEMQPLDFVITMLISNIATIPVENTQISLMCGIVPVLGLACFEIIFSMIIFKSKAFRLIVSGTPQVIIEEGKVKQEVMYKLRISNDDLMAQLRSAGIFDIRLVDFAFIETNGSLTVCEKRECKESEMMRKPFFILISDGILREDILAYCNRDERWLNDILNKEGYVMREIFLMNIAKNGEYVLMPKRGVRSNL